MEIGDYMSNEELYIDVVIDRKPYIKNFSNDPVINLTGESGSGKSFYAQQYLNDSNYVVLDTDDVFARFENATGASREYGEHIREKFDVLPGLIEEFDMYYQDMIEYFADCGKTLVIDSAQFRNMKDVSKLKGKLIVMRTSVNTCYDRCLQRYKNNNPNYSEEDFIKYKERKKAMYKWYLGLNDFLKRVDEVEV